MRRDLKDPIMEVEEESTEDEQVGETPQTPQTPSACDGGQGLIRKNNSGLSLSALSGLLTPKNYHYQSNALKSSGTTTPDPNTENAKRAARSRKERRRQRQIYITSTFDA